MPLSEAELSWIEYVTDKEITLQMQINAYERDEKRQEFLEKQIGAGLEGIQGELEKNLNLVITNKEDPGAMKKFWLAMTRQEAGTTDMKWRATDDDLADSGLGKWAMRMDIEVDTKEDIGENTMNIPPDQVAQVMQAHQRLLALQAHMENQLDDAGERLFSDEDIRKELWTPLLREGLIPENMIPDEYSEQAIAFQGAKELYEERLTEYSATHSKKVEKFKTGLRITKEIVTVTGAIVSNSITISNATTISDKNSDVTKLKKEDADLKAELDGDPAPSSERLAEIEERRAAIKTESTDLTKQITEMKAETTYAQSATAILLGGLDATDLVVDHVTSKEKDSLVKWCNTIEKGLALTQTMAVKSVDTAMRSNGASAGMITCVSSAISASFSAVKAVPTLVLAVKERDDDARARLIDKLIGNLADTVASSMASVAGKVNAEAKKLDSSDPDRQPLLNQEAQLKQIGEALKISISQLGKGPAVLRAIKNGNKEELAMLLGGAAIAATFGATSEVIYDAVHADSDSTDMLDMGTGEKQFHEATGKAQEAGQDAGSATSIGAINTALGQMSTPSLAGLKATTKDPLEGTSAKQLADQIEEEAERTIQERAQEELKEAFSETAMQKMMEEADQELVGFEELYSQAYPDSEITKRTPEEIAQATAAIDRAMANTAKLRQKVALINGLTATGAGVLAALVPGTGAVVAAQKVAKDIYVLKKSVDTHNAWVDSMEVAFAAQSGAAAAIQNTLKNAKIHLDHAKVSLVLHTAQAGAAVAQVMDPTGVSTIVSSSLSMADAVVEFGYKMHHENEIRKGWNAYKDARDNPGNRKRARKALRMNSTLAKCCIAYGASIMGDPSAQQAIRATGLTVAALQNDKDICVKLINYLENELNEDPVVMKVVNSKDSKWHPGRPELTLASWTAFKAAASRSATPLLSSSSMQTPAIDKLLADLGAMKGWQTASEFEKDKEKFEKAAENDPTTALPDGFADLLRVNQDAVGLLDRAQAAFKAYAPFSEGAGAAKHDGMEEIAATFATLARLSSATAAENADNIDAFIQLHS